MRKNANALDLPIDIVIPWVDGSDTEWIARRNQFQASEQQTSEVRFRDWDILQYLFRGIESFMPWVNKIHFVTWGHLPSWLKKEHPKLHIVNHIDFIPEKYLPTFSANAIELNFHRIEGLSEHFIYFNDDMFPVAPIPSTYYFINGMPCDYAIQNARSVRRDDWFFMPMVDDAVINSHFTKKATIKQNKSKWFHPKYGIYNLLNLVFMQWSTFTGFVDAHLPIAYTKSQFQRIWEAEPELLDESCSHRFRENTDVNQWLIRYWRICEGDFAPKACEKLDSLFSFEVEDSGMLERCCQTIRSQKRKVICINDGRQIHDFEISKKKLQEAFQEILPVKSSFEK